MEQKEKQGGKEKYVWKDIDYELAAIDPNYVPFEEMTKEEQAEAVDRMFDDDDD